jgi:hypothetical protein
MIVVAAVAAVALLVVAAEVLARLAERRLPTYLLWHDQLTTGKWRQLQRLRREPPLDVLLAGSSQMLMALDPTALPFRAYSAALYRGVPTVMLEWLRDEVLPATRPRAVVWGVSVLDLNDNGGFHQGITAKYRAGRPAPGLGRWARATFAVVRRWRLLLTPWRVLRLALPGEAAVGPEGKPLSRLLGPMGKGIEYADYDTYMLSDDKRAFIETEMVNAFSMGGAQVDALREGARLVTSTGARLVFVEMPFTVEFAEMYPPGAVSAARELLASVAAEVGAPWIPTDGDALPRDWFADCVHLNGVGMARWTETVGPVLAGAVRGARTGERAR